MIVYTAQLLSSQAEPFELQEVLTVQTNFDKLEEWVKDYFGINPNKEYANPAEYLGFTKIKYSEFEDPLYGYLSFKETINNEKNLIDKVYVYCLTLDDYI